MSDSINSVIECILRAMQKRTGDVRATGVVEG